MKYLHIPEVKVTAHFSKDNQFRYQLSITKTIGKQICVIMQNPSIACELFADKSVQFLENLVFKNEFKYKEFEGVGTIVIVNLFAFIQTNFFVGNDDQIGIENDEVIEKAIEKSDIILIAWGASSQYKKRHEFIFSTLKKNPDKPIYKTNKHPSRGSYKNFITEFK